MRIYLAGPINGCTDEEANDWRMFCIGLRPDIEWYDPMVRDYRGREAIAFREIVEQDKADIDACDALLVSYTKPSVGTSMEVLYAWERGKRIILVSAKASVLSPWLLYHANAICHSYHDAIASL